MIFKKPFYMAILLLRDPIACSAALTSLELFEKEQTLKKVEKISDIHREFINKLKKINISKPRVLGSIAAFEYNAINQKIWFIGGIRS